MTRRIVISGCSGGGKSTLIAALAAQGYPTWPEPGRLIVQQGLASGGTALPWVDPLAFACRVIEVGLDQHAAATGPLVFHDRSLIDAVTWFETSGTPLPARWADLVRTCRYSTPVFLTPPWPEIYRQDAERRHGLAAARAEYAALLTSYPAKGYGVAIIPQGPVPDRVAWVLDRLDRLA